MFYLRRAGLPLRAQLPHALERVNKIELGIIERVDRISPNPDHDAVGGLITAVDVEPDFDVARIADDVDDAHERVSAAAAVIRFPYRSTS